MKHALAKMAVNPSDNSEADGENGAGPKCGRHQQKAKGYADGNTGVEIEDSEANEDDGTDDYIPGAVEGDERQEIIGEVDATNHETETGEEIGSTLSDIGKSAEEKGECKDGKVVTLEKVHGSLLVNERASEANSTFSWLILQGVGSIILESN